MTTTTDAPIEIGAMARMIRQNENLDGRRTHRAGETFIVEDYVSADDPDNEEEHAFYYGSRGDGINNVCVWARNVEKVLSAEEMNNRKLPLAKDILDDVSCQMVGSFGGYTIDESYTDPFSGMVELFGETTEGLRFAVTLSVHDIVRADF